MYYYNSVEDSKKPNVFKCSAKIVGKTLDTWFEDSFIVDVLDVDYRSYALVHSCVEVNDEAVDSIWLFSRIPFASESVYGRIKSVIEQYTYAKLEQFQPIIHDC
jgi:hypothetical protein